DHDPVLRAPEAYMWLCGRRCRDGKRDLATPMRETVRRVEHDEGEPAAGDAAVDPTALCVGGHARGDEHEDRHEEECKDGCERLAEHRAITSLRDRSVF